MSADEEMTPTEIGTIIAKALFESAEGSMILVGAETLTLDVHKMMAHDDALANGEDVTVPITVTFISDGLVQVSTRKGE